MDRTYIPKNYKSNTNIRETEILIKQIKDYFQNNLSQKLNLTRVSAPLFVMSNTGLNDNLNGIERPVVFDIKSIAESNCEIVHSLAKWKRLALKRYGFAEDEGIYTDMNAIRRDEDTDNLHSIYVDQWDWEAVINEKNRNICTLKKYVDCIYEVLKDTEKFVCQICTDIKEILPDQITYVTTEELQRKYPDLTPKEREHKVCQQHKAVFLIGIGDKLIDGKPHDGRAPDYDDWQLNGDIILNYPLLDTAFEISSMGIRVDKEALKRQLNISGHNEWGRLPFQKAILENSLPFTIGGGIGQSRLCMFFLRKSHIGEVQASVWPQSTQDLCKENNIELL